jgi:branched-chain amino acid transport system permease protein
MVLVYVVLALSLQLVLGYGGMLNFGIVAFYGIGAYSYGLMAIQGIPFFISFLLGPLLASLFGYFLSLSTNKLKGDYLALATLGFSFVVYAVFLNWTSLTNGPLGLANIPRPQIFGLDLSNLTNFFIFALAFVIVSYLIINKIVKSSFGLSLSAIRDDELAARSLGKNAFKQKTIALVLSAFFAGLAGCLYASYITYIDPSAFSFSQIIPILVIVMVGGMATLPGTILSAIVLVLLPEPLRFIGVSSSIIGPVRQIGYAILLLLILNYRPKGLMGKIELE